VRRVLLPASIAGAVAWTVAVPLVATQAVDDPVGARYDGANRLLGVALLLLTVAALALRDRLREELARLPFGLTTWPTGLAFMFAGSVIEFWGAWIAGDPSIAEARRTGAEAWDGSDLGFDLFILGAFIGAGGAVAAAVRLRELRRGRLALAVAVAGIAMVAGTIVWTTSVVAALATALVAAAAWVAIPFATRPAVPSRT
jgi:hypothetical protein